MKSPESDPRLTQFPAALLQLLESERASGNAIVEVASCFPAPPAGAYAKLARPVTTRPRVTTGDLHFYDRNSSIYSGEWTDAKRFYFVLEPPRPPEPEPSMDAIREASNAPRGLGRNAPQRDVQPTNSAAIPAAVTPPLSSDVSGPAADSRVQRFRESMAIDYEKWHDGIGYDVELLKSLTPAERNEIEELVLARGTSNWRDIEALAALNTARAKVALKRAMDTGNAEIRNAVMRHAPRLVSEDDKTTFLLEALRTANFYGGLSQALDRVAEYHPPEIVAELFRGALERSGEVAIHFAAILMFIHGKAKEPFDWEHRPFFLRFDTSTRAEREAAFRELCEKLGVESAGYLQSGP